MNENFNLSIKAFLVVSTTLGFYAVIYLLFFQGEIPPSTKDILLVMLGTLIGNYKEVGNYFFGSSSSSAKKDEQNAVLTTQLAATSVAPVVAALGAGPTGKPGDPVSVDIETTHEGKQ